MKLLLKTLILMSFTTCAMAEADRFKEPLKPCQEVRPEVCAKEDRPVCATVDSGIRCIQTPCPTERRKTYKNVCDACADPRLIGYSEGKCQGGSKQ